MNKAAERGAKLTAQLLAFSRRQRLEPKPIDLNDTVLGMRDLLQSTMGGSVRLTDRAGIEIVVCIGRSDPDRVDYSEFGDQCPRRDAGRRRPYCRYQQHDPVHVAFPAGGTTARRVCDAYQYRTLAAV